MKEKSHHLGFVARKCYNSLTEPIDQDLKLRQSLGYCAFGIASIIVGCSFRNDGIQCWAFSIAFANGAMLFITMTEIFIVGFWVFVLGIIWTIRLPLTLLSNIFVTQRRK